MEQCKCGVFLGSLQIQLLVHYFLNLFEEQEPLGSFVLLYLGSTQAFTSRGVNEGRLRFGFDSSAPPGQTVQKSLGTGIYLKEGTVSNETIRNSCSSWNQLPPNPQSQLFPLLAPEDLDAALLPQKHLCFCLNWAQAASCNLIMHCCTKVISV